MRRAFHSRCSERQEPKFANKYLNAVAGGWNPGIMMYLFSGTPFSSPDSEINAQINPAGGFSGTFLATVIDPNIAKTCTAVHASVATPIQTNFGETGPSVFRVPGHFDIDNVASKKFFIHERMNFELGAQFANTLNHPNFSNPTSAITSGSLGATSGDVPRPPACTVRGRAHW